MNTTREICGISAEKTALLEKWYRKRVKIAWQRKLLRLYEPELVFCVIFFIMLANFELRPTGVLFGVVVGASMMAGFYSKRNEIQHQLKLEAGCSGVSRSDFGHVWIEIERLQDAMELRKPTRLYYRPSNSYVAYVHERWGEIHLVIPRNLFVLARRKPRQFSAILAHELAHVLQQDSYMWFSRRLNVASYVYVTAVVAVYLLFFCNIHEGRNALLAFCLGYPLYRATQQDKEFAKARWESELNADAAALLYSSPTAITEVLAGTYFSDHTSETLPSLKERLNSLQRLVADTDNGNS